MKITWKVVYAFLCFLAVFLIPLAYAEETVSVFFYKDGEKIESPKAGENVTLHTEIIGANSSDYVTLTLQDESLKFSSNPSKQTINVYGRLEGDNVWVYETNVDVLTDNPTLPKAEVIRDSTQPSLENSDKPTGVSIDLNSEQLVKPGETINAKATLEPSETVDPTYYNYLEWSVTYGDKTIELSKPRAQAIEFTIPDDALNQKIKVSAVLKGEECGLSENIAAKTVELKVNDESLSVQIFPSTDSEGVVQGKYLGFSSELLRNGKVAEDSAREGMTYWWTAQMGQQFVNGSGRNSAKFVYSPEETGTLTVYLTVTLANGVTLESNRITKTVVDSDSTLESIEIKKVESGETRVGDTVAVSYTLNPTYVTELEGATYKWNAVQGKETIATSDKLDDLAFKVLKEGVVKVTLTITPKDQDPITSNELEVNVSKDVPTKIYSGEITTKQDTDSLKVGDTLTLNANLVTEGDDNIKCKWIATDDSGDVIAESDELKDFSVKPEKAEDIVVTFTAEVDTMMVQTVNDPNSYQAIKLMESYSFKNAGTTTPVQKDNTDKNDSAPKPKEENNSTTNTEKENQQTTQEPVATEPATTEPAVNVGGTDETLVPKNQQNETAGTASDVKQDSNSEVDKVKSNVDEIVTTPEEQAAKAASDSKTGNKQVTANTTEQTSSKPTTNLEAGDNKTSSNNSTPASNTPRLSQNSGTVKTIATGTTTPTTSTSTQKVQPSTAQSGSVFNQSANVVNPKTGTDFTIGQLMVLVVCGFLIIVSTILLFRKRHQS